MSEQVTVTLIAIDIGWNRYHVSGGVVDPDFADIPNPWCEFSYKPGGSRFIGSYRGSAPPTAWPELIEDQGSRNSTKRPRRDKNGCTRMFVTDAGVAAIERGALADAIPVLVNTPGSFSTRERLLVGTGRSGPLHSCLLRFPDGSEYEVQRQELIEALAPGLIASALFAKGVIRDHAGDEDRATAIEKIDAASFRLRGFLS